MMMMMNGDESFPLNRAVEFACFHNHLNQA